MPGYLIAEEGPLTGLIIRMEEGEEWILGRDPNVSFQVLEDPMVSRKHLICRLSEEGFIVENLSVTNPVAINGTILEEPTSLQEGDILQIGGTLFKFTEHDPNLALPLEKDPLPVHHPTIFDEESPLDTLSLNAVTHARWMIKVISGPNTGAEFGLQEGHSYVLGKDPHSCDILFQDLSVSRQHAKISLDHDNNLTIEDLNSRNGTYVNSKPIQALQSISSQDLIAIGTTSLLLIDREQTRETIYSPPSALAQAYEQQEISEAEEIAKEKNWKDLSIPKKHLILAATFLLLLLFGITSSLSLFKTHHVEIAKQDDKAIITSLLKKFAGVEFSFNEDTGKIFILGDVLTDVEKQELLYLLKSQPYIQSIEDNVVVDEIVWGDMNAFIARNPNWRSVNMTALEPGKFVLRGYVQTLQEAANLMEYVTMHFPYNEKLQNQVVIANTLETEVQNMLIEKGFVNVTFQLSSGELILSGRVNEHLSMDFDNLVKDLKKVRGIRSIKNFVLMTTASTARINLSDKYKVTGTSKLGNMNQYVVINGLILTTGDSLDGMTITQIETDAILLEKDGLKYKINYNPQ